MGGTKLSKTKDFSISSYSAENTQTFASCSDLVATTENLLVQVHSLTHYVNAFNLETLIFSRISWINNLMN